MATKRKTRSRVATALKKYVQGNSKKNPRHVKGSTVSLRNFTGRVIRKRNGQVVILGRGKALNAGRRNGNGYVVYPTSEGYMSLAAANKAAKEESAANGYARVESVDTNETKSTWRWGKRV